MSVTVSTQQIAYFHLTPVPAANACCTNATALYVDDLGFDQPASSGPPDFLLSPATGTGPDAVGTLNAGQTAAFAMTVTRINGSRGPITFSYKPPLFGLPAGVTAAFVPSASTDSDAVSLELTATDSATAGNGAPIEITASPSGAGVGSTPRTLTFLLDVVPSYDARITGIEFTQSVQGLATFCDSIASCAGKPSLPAANANRVAQYDEPAAVPTPKLSSSRLQRPPVSAGGLDHPGRGPTAQRVRNPVHSRCGQDRSSSRVQD